MSSIFLTVYIASAQCTSPVPPKTGATLAEEQSAANDYLKVITDHQGCSKAGLPGCAVATGDLQKLETDGLNAAMQTYMCAMNGATSADKSWYAQRSDFWKVLVIDMKQSAAAVGNGTYVPSPDSQMQYLGITSTLASAGPTPPPDATKEVTKPVTALETTVSPTPTNNCTVSPSSPVSGTSTTTYKYSASCTGVVPTAIAVGPSTGKLDPKTIVPSESKSPNDHASLNAPRYDADRKFVSFAVSANSTAKEFHFQFDVPNPAAKNNGVRGSYYVSTGNTDIATCENADPTKVPEGCYLGAIQLPAVDTYAASQVFQGLAGIAVSGASASDPRATFLAEGKLDLPLSRHKERNIAAAVDLTSYAKIGAIGQVSSISSLFSSTTSAFTTVLSNPPQNIVQSYEMGGALGWRLPFPLWKQGDDLFTLSVIGGGGMLTPLSPNQVQPAEYIATNPAVQMYFENNNANNSANLAAQFAAACTDPTTNMPRPCYVQVYPADRLQFFRQYGGGLRLKFYAKDTTAGHADYRFPGNLDLTVGQNEYVTAGRLHGAVLHFGGEIPVPGADYVYINLGMDTSFVKTSSNQLAPLLLSPGTGVTIDPTTVVNVAQPQQNRDRYSVGVSIDIAHLFNHGTTTPSSPPEPTITTQPLSQQITSGSSLSLSVTATGTGTLSYQWYEGAGTSKPQSGATSDTYSPNPPPTASTSYWVQVTNTVSGASASKPSSTAVITVNK